MPDEEFEHIPEIDGVPDLEKPKRGLPIAPEYQFEEEKPRRRRGPLFIVIGCLLACCLCCVLPICLCGGAIGVAAGIIMENQATRSGVERVALDRLDTPITLDIDNRAGDIHITGDKNATEVAVEYTIHAFGWSNSEAQQNLRDIAVDVQSEADTVTVKITQRDDGGNFVSNLDEMFSHVNLKITVPYDLYLKIQNSGEISGIDFGIGTIDIENVNAMGLDINSTFAEVRFDGALDPSGTFDVESNSYIEFTLPPKTYVYVDAETDTGSVTVNNFVVDGGSSSGDNSTTHWTGTLGTGTEDPPTLRIRSNMGRIKIMSN
ncbi:MAG TPA: hypothetical protein VHP83_13975 [Aggregatilineaceae bacterium]|nr:hypothetical protein [Aggregatilineaceae bacterium]